MFPPVKGGGVSSCLSFKLHVVSCTMFEAELMN